jgi:hypothetical protein
MANKQVNQLATLSGIAGVDLIPVFDTDEAGDEKLKKYTVDELKADLTSTDPSAFGNWVELGSGTLSGGSFSTNSIISDLRIYNRVMLRFNINSVAESCGLFCSMHSPPDYNDANYDNTSGNSYDRQVIEGLTGVANIDMVYYPASKTFRTTGVGDIGSTKHVSHSMTYTGTADGGVFDITAYEASTVIWTGTWSLYVWKELKPIELASYELVKEYVLSSETLSADSFDWDGEADDSIMIEASIVKGSAADVTLNLNNDSGTNYDMGYLGQNGSVAQQGFIDNITSVSLCHSQPGSTFCRTYGTLKNMGEYRLFRQERINHLTSDSDLVIQETGYRWKNTSSDVTSLTIATSGAVTGTIKVYRMAKTHLFNQTIYNDITLNVTTAGSDLTGDGTIQKPFATIRGALAWLKNKTINSDATVAILLAPGHWSVDHRTDNDHTYSSKIVIFGTTDVGKTITSIQSVSGSAGDRNYIVNTSSVSNISVGDYVLVKNCSNVTNAEYLAGCHKVTNVDVVNTRITIIVTHKNATGLTGALNADIVVFRSTYYSSESYNLTVAYGRHLRIGNMAVLGAPGASVVSASDNATLTLSGDGVGISGGSYGINAQRDSSITCFSTVAISDTAAHGIISYYGSSVNFGYGISSGNAGVGVFVAYNSFLSTISAIITGNDGVAAAIYYGGNVRMTGSAIISGNNNLGISCKHNSTVQFGNGVIQNNSGTGVDVRTSGVVLLESTTNTDGTNTETDGVIHT